MEENMARLIFFSLGLVLLNCPLQAQTLEFSGRKWQVNAQTASLENYKGKQCVRLAQGGIKLAEAGFTNGVIEFDIAFGKERGFHGVQWRMQSNDTNEEFYLRPHQSGNPDATQYTPVFHGLAGWQLYHGEGYTTAASFDFDEWMHVKLVVAGGQAEVYLKDMSKPLLVMPELKQKIRSGGLGLSAALAPARFADFSYRADDRMKLQGEIKTSPVAPAGTIMAWQVSDVFEGQKLQDKVALEQADLEGLAWHPLACEKSGLANLARLQGVSQTKNTVFVKATLHSANAATKKLSFGYSDVAFVFLNGQALYLGQNTFLSRDYRYLGTIGYFDNVFLPLKAGDNELIIAVAETFGGWGIQARLEKPSEVAVK
jgi:hypothetical protein